jgi:hypothetical protein
VKLSHATLWHRHRTNDQRIAEKRQGVLAALHQKFRMGLIRDPRNACDIGRGELSEEVDPVLPAVRMGGNLWTTTVTERTC